MTADPTGPFVYVANQYDGAISGFSIALGTGTITPVPGSPFPTLGSAPYAITVDPTGRFLYTADANFNSSPDVISAFTINPATGALTPVAGTLVVASGALGASKL